MNITGTSAYENIRSKSVGTLGYLVKGTIQGVESISRGSEKINVGRRVNGISAKDRILYALQNNEQEKIDTYYNIFDIFDIDKKNKSTLIGNNKVVTLSINYTKNNTIINTNK